MADTTYLVAGSNILKNKLGITDATILQETEFQYCENNFDHAMALADRAKKLNEATWCRIHKALFGELYAWAGKMRTVEIGKGDYMFAPPLALKGHADTKVIPAFTTAAKAAKNDHTAFTDALAECWGELNFLHPFREGNGRSTQIFITALARRYGRSIDWRKVQYEKEIEAAILSMHGNYSGYADILRLALGPGQPGLMIHQVWPLRDMEPMTEYSTQVDI